MQAYWFAGHNQDYIQLLYCIDQRELDDDEGDARGSRTQGERLVFSNSFEHRAERLWQRLRYPFEVDTDGHEDFIASDSEDAEDEGGGAGPMPRGVFDDEDESDMEGHIVQALMVKQSGSPGMKGHKKRGTPGHPEIAEQYSEGEMEEYEPLVVDSSHGEEEEENDEWMEKKKKALQGMRSKKRPLKGVGGLLSEGKLEVCLPKEGISTKVRIDLSSPTLSVEKKHRRIRESDEEDLVFH